MRKAYTNIINRLMKAQKITKEEALSRLAAAEEKSWLLQSVYPQAIEKVTKQRNIAIGAAGASGIAGYAIGKKAMEKDAISLLGRLARDVKRTFKKKPTPDDLERMSEASRKEWLVESFYPKRVSQLKDQRNMAVAALSGGAAGAVAYPIVMNKKGQEGAGASDPGSVTKLIHAAKYRELKGKGQLSEKWHARKADKEKNALEKEARPVLRRPLLPTGKKPKEIKKLTSGLAGGWDPKAGDIAQPVSPAQFSEWLKKRMK